MSKSTDPESPAGYVSAAAPSGRASLPGEHPRQRWRAVAVGCFLAALVWAVFGQTRHFEFINYDDPDYVYQNPLTNQGLNWHNVVWVFTHENRHEWCPVTYVSRMVDSQFYGSNAGGHHLTNVLLHGATVILLFLVLRRLTCLRADATATQAGTFWRAAFVAALFAIHPLRVESVAWAVERKDVLSGLFFMLTLWAWTDYVRARPTDENQRLNPEGDRVASDSCHWLPAYLLALAFFALGLMSKATVVTLPFVLLLLDFWPLKRFPPAFVAASRQSAVIHLQPLSASGSPAPSGFRAWLGLIIEKLPFFLLGAAACLATALTQKNVLLTAQHSPLLWRIGNVVLAYAAYLKHTVYPVGLAVVYPYSDANPSLGRVGLAVVILLVISAGAVAGGRKHPWLLVGWLWYLVMLLPVIDSMQATQNTRADRYTYLPQIGLCIMVVWGLAEIFNRSRQRRFVLGFIAAIMLAVLLVDARIQTGYWKNSVTLWTRTLACTSRNYFAENCLGSALSNQGNWNAAVPHFERSLQYKPDYPEAHINLGIALANQGKREEAIQHFRRVLELNPNAAAACYNLAGVLADQGKTAEAIPYVRRALQLKADYPEAHYDLGLDLADQGKWDEAIPEFEQALQQKLDATDVRYITGVALAAHAKWVQAIALYEQALQSKPDFAEAHYRLGIALASQGRPAEAMQHFQTALTLATAQGNAALADSIRKQLKAQPPAAPPPPAPQ
jgi:tetratricopeptide (TPR) repeat protein